ncbi:hypothetical protein IWW43_006520, partial [Coemansia sp. RSA 1935]
MQSVSGGTLNGGASVSPIVDRQPEAPDAVVISFNSNDTETADLAHALHTRLPPRTPAEVILRWNKLTYNVESKSVKALSTRTILSEITGEVRGGEM